MIRTGVRVVRGPGWKWDKQDGGEGYVGTVIELGRSGSKTSPDKTVVVQWDSGSRTNYRTGYQSAYDLRLLDNAQIGVKHPGTSCAECPEENIAGMRWCCTKCQNIDLCSPCYMRGAHDCSHTFVRYTDTQTAAVRVPKRSGATKVMAKGVYAGAKVERGPDWDWDTQDGGDGAVGKVLDIRGWDNETGRSVANIVWPNGCTNVYRMGHHGKVDLKYSVEATGGSFFRDHLPLVGDTAAIANHNFKNGEKVRIRVSAAELRKMQEGHGGWNPKMADVVRRAGFVHRVTDKGDIRVQFDSCAHRWTFNPAVLNKIPSFRQGDRVKILSDAAMVRELQVGHGEWTDSLSVALGATGRVQKIYNDGDLRVEVANHMFTFNPACCARPPLAKGTAPSISSTAGGDNTMPPEASPKREKKEEQRGEEIKEIVGMEGDSLVKFAATGNLDELMAALEKNPDSVNQKGSGGKTALHVAAHQGHTEIVTRLLDMNADGNDSDSVGDTALHYSAFGNQPAIMRLLLGREIPIDSSNHRGCATLHVAVDKQYEECVNVLLEHNCDVNAQDKDGDTPLHDAVCKQSKAIVESLLNHASIDLTVQNERRFNILHHASCRGNTFAVEKILDRSNDLVNLAKDDGFAPLHLSALNGHTESVAFLITKGKADVDQLTNRKQSALFLATSRWHTDVVEFLLKHGASANKADEDGDTPLRICLSGGADPSVVGGLREEESPRIAIARALLGAGASHLKKNRKGQLPFDNVEEVTVASLLHAIPEPPECMICAETKAAVRFEPCDHLIVCETCCIKMKKCLSCKTPITKKLNADGDDVLDLLAVNTAAATTSLTTYAQETENGEDSKEEVARRLQEIEESVTCSICLDNRNGVVFLCGHSVCGKCAQSLRFCHMCRKPITKRINIFT